MNASDLREQIEIELGRMAATLAEISSLQDDLRDRVPSHREKAAAGAFLSQLYGGLENILVRVCKCCGVAIPGGDEWHAELFKKFCDPPQSGLPLLFDKGLEDAVSPYRRFRHLFTHTYGILLDWDKMREGVAKAKDVFDKFVVRVRAYLQTL